jgi:hypothetical protein
VSMTRPSFALNLSRETRRMRARHVSNASRYTYEMKPAGDCPLLNYAKAGPRHSPVII